MKWYWIIFICMVQAEPIIKVITCRCEKAEEKMQEMIDTTPQTYILHTMTYNSFWDNCIIALAFDEELVYVPPIHS